MVQKNEWIATSQQKFEDEVEKEVSAAQVTALQLHG
jgi:hypothetical protein